MSMRTLQDILPPEQTEQPDAGLHNTYALLARGAAIEPQAPALTFFARAEEHATPARWNHAQLLGEITRAANLFRRLGIQRSGVAKAWFNPVFLGLDQPAPRKPACQ